MAAADPWAEFRDAPRQPNAQADPWAEFQDPASAGAAQESPSAFSTFMKTPNAAISSLLGAPVDVVTTIVNDYRRRASGLKMQDGKLVQEKLDPITNPIGGTQSIREGLNATARALGSTDEQGAVYYDIQDLPQSHRPLAVAGETFFGSVIPGAMGVQYLNTAAKVPQMLQPMANFAQSHPKAALAAEVAGSFGAAQGGAIAEMAAPGSPTARAIGETIGGFVSPSSLGSRTYRLLKSAGGEVAGRVVPSVRRAASEAEASRIIGRVLQDAGEDPEALAKILEQPDAQGLNLTAGQKTGSRALLNLEAKLADTRPGVGAEADARRKSALAQLRTAADDLAATGDPAAVRAAAALRQEYFSRLMRERILAAQREAGVARENVTRGTGTASMMDAGGRATAALDRAWADARNVERELWGVVPSDVPAPTQNILAAYTQARGELLPNVRLPEKIDGYMRILRGETAEPITIEYPDGTVKQVGGPNYKPTSGDLKNLRSQALTLERQAKAQNDRITERHMNMIARAALRDLEAMDLPGLADARAYSSAMHDAFTQTFAKEVLDETPLGGERIPAPLALDRAFGPGGATATHRFGELQGAAEFPEGARWQTGPDMYGAQQQYLQGQAARLADPETGAFNVDRVQRFMDENAPLLQRFPQLRANLENIVKAERGLAGTEATAAGRLGRVNKALGTVLRSEDPVRAVGEVLRGRNPSRDYSLLVSVAQKGGADAVAGLRAATLRTVLQSATTPSGTFSFVRFRDALARPMPGSKQSLIETMKQSGVLDEAAAQRLDAITTRALRLENAEGDPRAIERLFSAPDAMLDLLARIVGARIGARLGEGTGSTLVGAARGSRVARDIMQKLPLARVSDVLVEAVENPQFMAVLMRRARTPAERAKVNEAIHGFLIQAGITATEDAREPAQPQQQSRAPVQPVALPQTARIPSQQEMLAQALTQGGTPPAAGRPPAATAELVRALMGQTGGPADTSEEQRRNALTRALMTR